MANWMLPLPPQNRMTGHFGKKRTFKGAPKNPHRGTDWALKNGQLIHAITDGKIMLIQYSKILGWVVVQSAKDNAGKVWYIGYCHLKESPKNKKVGDRVKMGDWIAKGGNTGSASSGPHLHATLSDSVKGVFWGNVYDLHAMINKNAGPGPEENVEVKLIPKNGNVVVEIGNFPKGNHLRLRKDGKSVWAKTVKEDKVHRKGITLTGEHELCIEFNGKQFFCEKVKAGGSAPARNPWAGKGKAKVEEHKTRQAYEATKQSSEKPLAKAQAEPEKKIEAVTSPKVEESAQSKVPVHGSLDNKTWAVWQEALRAHGYNGPTDGEPGKLSWSAVQRSGQEFGYNGPIDGEPGGNTYKSIQRRLTAKGFYEGRTDGNFGSQSIKALQKALNAGKY